MSSALEGPVSVCVDRQTLPLDRPFTYLLPAGFAAGIGSLVKVPFHGKQVNGWILGPTDDVPKRMLAVKKVVSPVRFFDEDRLELLKWVAERYVSPLATVIDRSHPPRVAAEDAVWEKKVGASSASMQSPDVLRGYIGGQGLARSLGEAKQATFVVRPAPGDAAGIALEAVARCLRAGRRAIVLIPEYEPLPEVARLVLEAAGERGVLFAGGDRRKRYRTWLECSMGRYDVVVGTRPAVFAPVPDVGLMWVERESHALHREERSPHLHVRDVALARGRLEDATVVLSAFCPSTEASARGFETVEPRGRCWPPVEVVAPGPEGRAQRLVTALRSTSGAFLFEPIPGYGVARVCRSCGEPASCAACGGLLRMEEGKVSCAVCGADGHCANCRSTDLGLMRGGVERVQEWAATLSPVPVEDALPAKGRVVVGGASSVKDVGRPELDLVAILNADVSAALPGLYAAERTLAVWMEAAGLARQDGRVIVQSRHPKDPAIQSLVSGNPERFHRSEVKRRADAGFPVGAGVFRITGTTGLPGVLEALRPTTLLVTSTQDEAICLLTLDLDRISDFGVEARKLATEGLITRVEAEPHL